MHAQISISFFIIYKRTSQGTQLVHVSANYITYCHWASQLTYCCCLVRTTIYHSWISPLSSRQFTDRAQHRSATVKSIGKAAELVSKAVGALRRKAGVLRARLLFLASPRRRAVVFAGISRHIRALTPRQLCQDKVAAAAMKRQQYYCRGAYRPLAPADDDDNDDEGVAVAAGGGLPHHHLPVVPAASLLLVVVQDEEGDGGSDGGCGADWTLALRSLFDDDEGDGHRGGDGCLVAAATGGLDDDDSGEDGTSVIDVIRRRREGDGQEFRIEDEIDRAADMYITRVRRRMTTQLEDLI